MNAPAIPRTSALVLGLLGPCSLLAGALAFEYIGGLAPCELCIWQRWPLVFAVVFALVAAPFASRPIARALLVLSGVAMLTSAGLAFMHMGIEQHWWAGPTRCSTLGPASSGGDFVRDMLSIPVIRCDEVPWQLFGISLAGYNLLASGLIGGLIIWLTIRHRPWLDRNGKGART